MGKILARGHSRVPVYSGNPKNIIGLLLVGEQTPNCAFARKIFLLKQCTFLTHISSWIYGHLGEKPTHSAARN